MKGGYKETEKYWDKVFKQEDLYDPFEKLSYSEMEEAIQWLCKDSDFILDFGCGNGKVLNRCLNYKVKKVYGIDLSEQAINIAKKVVNNNQLQDKCNYLYGGIDLLKKLMIIHMMEQFYLI
ncbi:class I SAM-dependent methyltransferase [Halothermothrix orenii]|nr:class I SAM-dependent methyltransferase [Halothermothrix orenii]